MDWLSPQSYWHATAPGIAPTYPGLDQDIQADVVIVGAGITGLTAGLHLKQAGRRVAILEAGRVGAGTTTGTSGHLDVLPDQEARTLIKDFGAEAARTITAARMDAIAQIGTWSRDFQIDCDFRRIPAFVYTESGDGVSALKDECEAVKQLGLNAMWLDRLDLPFETPGAFRVENLGRFHALRYLRALAERFHGDGCTIYEHTRAHPPADGKPCTVEAAGKKVSAAQVLLCTHSAYLGISQFDMRMAPYQSYVLTARVENDVPDGLLLDDAEPYHYTRWSSSNDPKLLIIGGADHKTGQGGNEAEHFHQLEQYVRQHFAVQTIEQRWSAELFEPSDGVPFIGRVPMNEHLYLATGYSGTGLTYGTAAGRILADLVLDRESPAAEVFSPSRFKPVAAGKDLVVENLNVAKQYVADRFRSNKIDTLDAIAVGEGRLVTYNGKELAVYRDDRGMFHVLSPTCTHAGCHVQWNEAETTWDCPCHGGRYSPLGERIYGPPPHDLERKPLEEL